MSEPTVEAGSPKTVWSPARSRGGILWLLLVLAFGCSRSNEEPPQEPPTAAERRTEESVDVADQETPEPPPSPPVDERSETETPRDVTPPADTTPEPAAEVAANRVPTLEELDLPDPPQVQWFKGQISFSLAVSAPRGWKGQANLSIFLESGEPLFFSTVHSSPSKGPKLLGTADAQHEWLLYEFFVSPSSAYLTRQGQLKRDPSEAWIVLADLSGGDNVRSGLSRVEWKDAPLDGLHRNVTVETTDARDWSTLVLPNDWRYEGFSPPIRYARQKGGFDYRGEITDRIPLPPGSEFLKQLEWGRFSTKQGSDWRGWSRGEPLRSAARRPVLTPPEFPASSLSQARKIPLLLALQVPRNQPNLTVTVFRPDGMPIGVGTTHVIPAGRDGSSEKSWGWYAIDLTMSGDLTWGSADDWLVTVDSYGFASSMSSGLIPQLPRIQSPVFEALRVVVPTRAAGEFPSKKIQFEAGQISSWNLTRSSPMGTTSVFQSAGHTISDEVPELPYPSSIQVIFRAMNRQPIALPFDEIEESQQITLEQGAYLAGSIPRDTPPEGWSFRFQNSDGLDETHTTSRQGNVGGMHLPTGPITVTVSLRDVVVHTQILDLSPGRQDLRTLLPPFEEFARLVRIKISGTVEKPVRFTFEDDRRGAGVLKRIGDIDEWEIFLWAPRKQPDSATIRYSNRSRIIETELDLSQDEILLTAPSDG